MIILALANLAFGFVIPAVDNWAHIGGLISGLASGYFLISYTNGQHRFITNSGTIQSISVLILGLSILTALLAIGHVNYDP